MFIKVLINNIEEERKTVTNVAIAVRVPGQYPIWFLLPVRIRRKKGGIDQGDMKKEYKNVIEQIVTGLISTLLVIGFFYYLFFHRFIHDRAIQLWEMIQLIIN